MRGALPGPAPSRRRRPLGPLPSPPSPISRCEGEWRSWRQRDNPPVPPPANLSHRGGGRSRHLPTRGGSRGRGRREEEGSRLGALMVAGGRTSRRAGLPGPLPHCGLTEQRSLPRRVAGQRPGELCPSRRFGVAKDLPVGSGCERLWRRRGGSERWRACLKHRGFSAVSPPPWRVGSCDPLEERGRSQGQAPAAPGAEQRWLSPRAASRSGKLVVQEVVGQLCSQVTKHYLQKRPPCKRWFCS